MAKVKTTGIELVVKSESVGRPSITEMIYGNRCYEAFVSVYVKPFGKVADNSVMLPEHLVEKAEALFTEINEYVESVSE